MIISTGQLRRDALAGRTAIVTGAGGGVRYETARALSWLGARVVIAEIDRIRGRAAAGRLNAEHGNGSALFVRTNIGDESSVRRLTRRAATINDELESSGVSAFSIGPGFVPTATALDSLPVPARLLGKSVDELREAVNVHALSVEAAGAGVAAAVAMADRYGGQEISSLQALLDAGLRHGNVLTETGSPAGAGTNKVRLRPAAAPDAARAPCAASSFTDCDNRESLLSACKAVRDTLAEQSEGWKERSVFEQQWLVRTFRRKSGLAVEEWIRLLDRMESLLQIGHPVEARTRARERASLERLAEYYGHLHEMATGYVRNPAERERQLEIVISWKHDVQRLDALLSPGATKNA